MNRAPVLPDEAVEGFTVTGLPVPVWSTLFAALTPVGLVYVGLVEGFATPDEVLDAAAERTPGTLELLPPLSATRVLFGLGILHFTSFI